MDRDEQERHECQEGSRSLDMTTLDVLREFGLGIIPLYGVGRHIYKSLRDDGFRKKFEYDRSLNQRIHNITGLLMINAGEYLLLDAYVLHWLTK